MNSVLLAAKICSQIFSPLSFEDVLQEANVGFPKLIASRLEIPLAKAKSQEKRGAFDPIVRVDTDFLRYNSSSSPGVAKQLFSSEFALDILDRSGIKVSVGSRLNVGAVKSPSSSTGSLGEHFIIAKIPLVRDRSTNAKSISELQAKVGEGVADQIIREVQLDTFEKVGLAYWDWIGAGAKIKVAKEVLSLAEARAEYIRKRVTSGANPPIDQREADSEVYRRQGLLIKAQRDLQKYELKLQMFRIDRNGSSKPTPSWQNSVQFLDQAYDSISEKEVASARTLASAERPELAILNLTREILELDLKLAQNQRRPSFDLTLGPSLDLGANGIGNPAKVGLSYSVPVHQNSANGQLMGIQTKIEKLNLEKSLLENSINIEISDSSSMIFQAEKRVEAAKDELRANIDLERGERVRFDEGLSSLFLINQRERSRAEAESRLIDLQVELRQARVSLMASSTGLLNLNLEGRKKS